MREGNAQSESHGRSAWAEMHGDERHQARVAVSSSRGAPGVSRPSALNRFQKEQGLAQDMLQVARL